MQVKCENVRQQYSIWLKNIFVKIENKTRKSYVFYKECFPSHFADQGYTLACLAQLHHGDTAVTQLYSHTLTWCLRSDRQSRTVLLQCSGPHALYPLSPELVIRVRLVEALQQSACSTKHVTKPGRAITMSTNSAQWRYWCIKNITCCQVTLVKYIMMIILLGWK